MARARTIKPGYFTNDLLAECDPLARILFAGLWTVADRDGRMVCRPARIKAQVLPYDDCDIDELLWQLQRRRFVVIYEVDGVRYLQIEGFARHQNPHPREVSESIPEPTAESEVTESREKVLPSHVKALPSSGESGTSNALSPFPIPLSPLPSPVSLLPSALSVGSSDMRDAQSKRRTRSNDPLSWNVDDEWVGITDADRADWAEAFPAVDIDAKLKGLTLWLKANPKKAKKSRWRSWLLGRLREEQDKGGTRTAGATTERRGPSRAHIPEDAHPDDEHMWFMTNGWTPRLIPIYRTRDGRERWRNGDYIDEETSQEHADENDE